MKNVSQKYFAAINSQRSLRNVKRRPVMRASRIALIHCSLMAIRKICSTECDCLRKTVFEGLHSSRNVRFKWPLAVTLLLTQNLEENFKLFTNLANFALLLPLRPPPFLHPSLTYSASSNFNERLIKFPSKFIKTRPPNPSCQTWPRASRQLSVQRQSLS